MMFDAFNSAHYLEIVEDKIDLVLFSSTAANSKLLALPSYSAAKAVVYSSLHRLQLKKKSMCYYLF